jgi:putative transposase
MLHSWPFGQLLEFLKYEAARAGVEVIEVAPRKTSQTCCKCGHAERGNRPRQSVFTCRRCGHTIHADLNAARVIAARGACSPGVGEATAPLSGEARVARKGRHRGNRDLESSS